MRYRSGLVLVVAALVLLAASASEAACRAGGEYRVTGTTAAGSLALTETAVADQASSGTAVMNLTDRRACPACLLLTLQYTGQYQAAENWDGGCRLTITVRDPVAPLSDRTGGLGGTLAFGGAVILFDVYDTFYLNPVADLNLTLGIRTDFLLKP